MVRILKILCIAIVFTSIYFDLEARTAEKDYTLYHRGIIEAEYAIFISNDSIKGLQLFKQTFDKYDFVFVDDCIEAFQLALFYKQEDYAMQFIKKALENGFEIKLLDLLNQGCPCNYYMESKNRVTIHKPFVEKHRAELESYTNGCYTKYLQRIDKWLFIAVLKRHVTEQLYKDHAVLNVSGVQKDIDYVRVTNDNLRFMDSLAEKNIFLGERNLGIYTNKLADSLRLPFKSVENYRADVLKAYSMPKNTHVSNIDESYYFDAGPVFLMQWHNTKSYDLIYKYKDAAMRKGYLHPREYASLRFNDKNRKIKDEEQLFLTPSYKQITDTKTLDERRAKMLLPSYEIDYAKHLFEHKNNLQLFFGHVSGTR